MVEASLVRHNIAEQMKRAMWGPPPPIPALMAPSAMTVGQAAPPEGVVEPIAPPQSRPRPSTAPNLAGSAA